MSSIKKQDTHFVDTGVNGFTDGLVLNAADVF